MVEAQLKELATTVQSAQTQLMASEAARLNLQPQVELLVNGRLVLTHGISEGLLSSMAQISLGGIGQLSFAVTLLWCIRH